MTSLPQQKGGEVTGCFYAVFVVTVKSLGAFMRCLCGCFYAVLMWVLLSRAYDCAYDCVYPVALEAHESEQDFSHLLTVCPREDI